MRHRFHGYQREPCFVVQGRDEYDAATLQFRYQLTAFDVAEIIDVIFVQDPCANLVNKRPDANDAQSTPISACPRTPSVEKENNALSLLQAPKEQEVLSGLVVGSPGSGA